MTGPRGLLAASLRVDAAANEAVDATIDRRGPVPTVCAVSELMKKTLIDAPLIRFHKATVCFNVFRNSHNLAPTTSLRSRHPFSWAAGDARSKAQGEGFAASGRAARMSYCQPLLARFSWLWHRFELRVGGRPLCSVGRFVMRQGLLWQSSP